VPTDGEVRTQIADDRPSVTTRSVRTQLLLGIAGVVMLTILLFAAAVWRFVLQPAEEELAARDMRHAAIAASSQVRSLVEGLERIVGTARQWGANGQLYVGDHEEFNRIILPVIGNRPEITAALLAAEDGQETSTRCRSATGASSSRRSRRLRP